jgi:HEXXH motif-containing protein
MHLQLTLIEQIVPLILFNNRQYFSPWRGEYRPTQGILHALYVFRVIDEFLKGLLVLSSYHSDEEHKIHMRRNEIAKEICRINSFQYCPDLTPLGSTFVQHLIVS